MQKCNFICNINNIALRWGFILRKKSISLSFLFQGTLSFRAHPPSTQALLGRRRRFFIIIIMRANEDILGRNLAQPFYPFCNTSAASLSPGFSSARLCWFFFFVFREISCFSPFFCETLGQYRANWCSLSKIIIARCVIWSFFVIRGFIARQTRAAADIEGTQQIDDGKEKVEVPLKLYWLLLGKREYLQKYKTNSKKVFICGTLKVESKCYLPTKISTGNWFHKKNNQSRHKHCDTHLYHRDRWNHRSIIVFDFHPHHRSAAISQSDMEIKTSEKKKTILLYRSHYTRLITNGAIGR